MKIMVWKSSRHRTSWCGLEGTVNNTETQQERLGSNEAVFEDVHFVLDVPFRKDSQRGCCEVTGWQCSGGHEG